MALTDNLISCWELEEASGTRVDAVVASGNDLTSTNSVGQNTGKVGNAGQFAKASARYLSRTSNSSLQTGNIDWTIIAWVYMDTNTIQMEVVTKLNIDTVAGEYQLKYDNPTDRFIGQMWNGSTTKVVGDIKADTFGSPSTATWYMLMLQYDSGGGTGYISVNAGTRDSAAKTGNPGTDTTEFRIGSFYSAGGGSLTWDGRIDQVCFWKRLLSTAEISQMYNSGNGLSYAAMQSAAAASVYTGQGPLMGHKRNKLLRRR